MTETITDIIPFKSVDISNTKFFSKKNKIIKELNNKISLYDNYLNDYASKNLNEFGSQKIIDIINQKYFKKSIIKNDRYIK